MIERRQHRRINVNCWASMKHPLLGTITAEVEDISFSGLSVRLDETMNLFVMMELNLRLHGDEWDEAMPDLPVQVVRVDERHVALKFCQEFDRYWIAPITSDKKVENLEPETATADPQDVLDDQPVKKPDLVAARAPVTRTDSDSSTASRKTRRSVVTETILRRLVPHSQ